MESFFVTLEIVCGILLPPFVLIAIWFILAMTVEVTRITYDKVKKSKPFDEVDYRMDLGHMYPYIRLWKKGKIVYEGRIKEIGDEK